MKFSQQMYVEVEAPDKDAALQIIYTVLGVVECLPGVTDIDASPKIEEAEYGFAHDGEDAR